MHLVQFKEEQELFEKLVDYYHRLHEDIKFTKREEILSPQQISELKYTYPGVESQVGFAEVVHKIKKAVTHGYDTPIIILRKKDGDVLIDGHRRIRAAWELGLSWKAYVMIPDFEKEFGIEKHVMGKVKDLWRSGELADHPVPKEALVTKKLGSE